VAPTDPTGLLPIVRDPRRPLLLRAGSLLAFVFVWGVMLIGFLFAVRIVLAYLGIWDVE